MTENDAAALADLIAQHGPVVAIAGGGLAQTAGIEPAETGTRGSIESTWGYWRPRMQEIYDTPPSQAHKDLRTLAESRAVAAVISDADGWLLEEAGVDAITLVPTVAQSICPNCGYTEPLGCLLSMPQVPVCAACGAILEPGPVTATPDEAIRAARDALEGAGLLLVLGSALDHATAQKLVQEHLESGGKLALAGTGETVFDAHASWSSQDLAGTLDALASATASSR